MPSAPPLPVEPLGDAAAIVRLGDTADVATARRVRAALSRVTDAPPDGVIDTCATFTTLAVFFDPARTDAEAIAAALRERLRNLGDEAAPPPATVDIPVDYGGDAGPDLEAVAAAVRLAPAEVVRLHRDARHVVGMIGFAPGFPYLLGLPATLHLPRRAVPRAHVPAGSVAIAAGQTGIYPHASPGGWHVIGRTTTSLFDPFRTPPALLGVGDVVRFVPTEGLASPDGPPRGAVPCATRVGTILVRAAGGGMTVQDAGRTGWRGAGVGPGGAADRLALDVASILVGNAPGTAVLEWSAVGPRLEFLGGAWVALGGAAFDARVLVAGQADMPLPRLHAAWVPAGATLAIGAPGPAPHDDAPRGLRGCLAVAGGIDVPRVLGSRSTCVRSGFGGWGGRVLGAGDRIAVGTHALPEPAEPSRPLVLPRTVGPGLVLPGGAPATLRIVPGPEAARFSAHERDLLGTATFGVAPDSDRMGTRLTGPGLGSPSGILSEAVVAGTVQVTPGGQAIVLGADHPVTGGYARIAVVATVDLPVVAHLQPGDSVRFEWIDLVHARRLAAARALNLDRLRVGWRIP